MADTFLAPNVSARYGVGAYLRAALIPPVTAIMWTRALYLALSFPIGIASFVLLVAFISVGFTLSFLLIGLVFLAALLVTVRALGTAERALARTLLGESIARPRRLRDVPGGWGRRLIALVRSAVTWRALLWTALRFPLGIMTFLVLTVGFALIALLLIGPWTSDLTALSLGPRIFASVGGVALLLLMFHAIDAMGWAYAQLARVLLGPSPREQLFAVAARAEQAEAEVDLARELHDSVGHAMTASMLQAAAARRVLATDPAFAEQALIGIEEQSRRALDELDRVLGVLRHGSAADLAPASLAGVEGLVERTRATGTPVEVFVSPQAHTVGLSVSRAAYRIIQEALTNVLRHAAGAPTRVEVHVEPAPDGARIVRVRIVNGPGGLATVPRAAGAGGRGLRGITARAQDLEGWADAAPTTDGGFIVRAQMIDRSAYTPDFGSGNDAVSNDEGMPR